MQTTMTAAPGRLSSGIGSPVKALNHSMGAAWSLYAAWKAGRDTRHALTALDDRMLEDIGLSRGGIDAAARDVERRMSKWWMAS